MRRPIRHVIAALLLVSAGPACTAGAAPAAPKQLIVFEAASLKDAFAKLAPPFEKENGASVIANAAGSQELRMQIEQGAAADVMASADRKQMDALAAQGLVASPAVFTCNEPVVVVRSGMAATIRTLADLPRADRIVVGVPEVPIGAYTLEILQKAASRLGAAFPERVQAKVVSREFNVRQVLAKVVLGEADAAVVYRSDAIRAAGKVAVVAIPPEANVVAEYPIAPLKAAPHADLARRFIELVKSPAGAAALGEAGFVACPNP